MAAGLTEIGDRRAVRHLDYELVQNTIKEVERRISECVDRMKPNANLQPLLTVGGGAVLAPAAMNGISKVVSVPHHGVANAVGAAMAQVSGEVDHVFRDVPRDELLLEAERMARDRAVFAGADPSTLEVVDVEDLPLAYLPGNAVRARVRVVGEIAALATR